DDVGSYTITFFAANRLLATASTVVTVTNTDRAPVVTVPAAVSGSETAPLTVDVTAADPAGDPIASLPASLVGLPAGASFTAGPGNTTGTLTWTPDYRAAGSYNVRFTAANALSGSATTAIDVSNV